MPARFASTWGSQVPPRGERATPVVCPNCGSPHAEMDRVGSRVFGWHDPCEWQDSLRVVVRDGAIDLEPWARNAR